MIRSKKHQTLAIKRDNRGTGRCTGLYKLVCYVRLTVHHFYSLTLSESAQLWAFRDVVNSIDSTKGKYYENLYCLFSCIQ